MPLLFCSEELAEPVECGGVDGQTEVLMHLLK